MWAAAGNKVTAAGRTVRSAQEPVHDLSAQLQRFDCNVAGAAVPPNPVGTGHARDFSRAWPAPTGTASMAALRWLPRSSVLAQAKALCACSGCARHAIEDAERPRRHSQAEREERSVGWPLSSVSAVVSLPPVGAGRAREKSLSQGARFCLFAAALCRLKRP